MYPPTTIKEATVPRGISHLTNSPQLPGRCWGCHTTSRLSRVKGCGTICRSCNDYRLANAMSSRAWLDHVNALDQRDRDFS